MTARRSHLGKTPKVFNSKVQGLVAAATEPWVQKPNEFGYAEGVTHWAAMFNAVSVNKRCAHVSQRAPFAKLRATLGFGV